MLGVRNGVRKDDLGKGTGIAGIFDSERYREALRGWESTPSYKKLDFIIAQLSADIMSGNEAGMSTCVVMLHELRRELAGDSPVESAS